MSGSKETNLSTYSAQAQELANQYNAHETPALVPKFAQAVFDMGDVSGKAALDIGCGTGRDAHWLAEQGFEVVACDGAEDMIKTAQSEKAHERVKYIQDTAPDMTAALSLKQQYDVILMNAFIFHLDFSERNNELGTFFNKLAQLGKPGSFVYTNLRHGPIPPDRVMFDIPLDRVQAEAEANGLVFESLGQSPDGLGRKEIHWDDIAIHFPK